MEICDGYLDEIVDGYIAVAFWTEEIELGCADIELSEEARQKALEDCKKFYLAQKKLIDSLCNEGVSYEQVGHDFWLTRNRHGTGFWDRDYGNAHVREYLTKKAHQLGESHLYRGDDGLAYFF